MGIGAGILLIAVGAILTFATNWHLSGIDLHAVGWVLMVVGVLGLVLFFTFWNNRRRPTGPAVVTDRPVTTERVVDRPVTTERTTTYHDPAGNPPPPGY
jgi:hypothetical protein